MSSPEAAGDVGQNANSRPHPVPVFPVPDLTTTLTTIAPPMPLPDLHFPSRPIPGVGLSLDPYFSYCIPFFFFLFGDLCLFVILATMFLSMIFNVVSFNCNEQHFFFIRYKSF